MNEAADYLVNIFLSILETNLLLSITFSYQGTLEISFNAVIAYPKFPKPRLLWSGQVKVFQQARQTESLSTHAIYGRKTGGGFRSRFPCGLGETGSFSRHALSEQERGKGYMRHALRGRRKEGSWS